MHAYPTRARILRSGLVPILSLLGTPAMAQSTPEGTRVLGVRAGAACLTEQVRVTGFALAREESGASIPFDGYRITEILVGEGDTVTSGQEILRAVRQPGATGGDQPGAARPQSPRRLHPARADRRQDHPAQRPGRDGDRRPRDDARRAAAAIGAFRAARSHGADRGGCRHRPPGRRPEPVRGPRSGSAPRSGSRPTRARDIRGTVRVPVAEVDPRTQLGRARLSVEPANALRPGQFASAVIETARDCGVSVPRGAVTYRDGVPTVQVLNGTRVETPQHPHRPLQRDHGAGARGARRRPSPWSPTPARRCGRATGSRRSSQARSGARADGGQHLRLRDPQAAPLHRRLDHPSGFGLGELFTIARHAAALGRHPPCVRGGGSVRRGPGRDRIAGHQDHRGRGLGRRGRAPHRLLGDRRPLGHHNRLPPGDQHRPGAQRREGRGHPRALGPAPERTGTADPAGGRGRPADRHLRGHRPEQDPRADLLVHGEHRQALAPGREGGGRGGGDRRRDPRDPGLPRSRPAPGLRALRRRREPPASTAPTSPSRAAGAEIGGRDQAIRTLASAKTLDDLAGTMLTLPTGGQVRLEDLGQVADTIADRRTFARLNGEPVVAIGIKRAQGASDVVVAKAGGEARRADPRRQSRLRPQADRHLGGLHARQLRGGDLDPVRGRDPRRRDRVPVFCAICAPR